MVSIGSFLSGVSYIGKGLGKIMGQDKPPDQPKKSHLEQPEDPTKGMGPCQATEDSFGRPVLKPGSSPDCYMGTKG